MFASMINMGQKNQNPCVNEFGCKDIGLAKRLLGYCFWLLGSGLTAASDDIIKAACQYK